MIVIADSNLLFSALYSPNGIIATILKDEKNVQFIAPDFVYIEIKNHLTEIAISTGKSKKQLLLNLKNLVVNIKFIEVEKIPMLHINKAIDIVKDIDIDDAFFVALHLFKKHKIWTGDKTLIDGLLLKGYDICVTTTQLKSKIYKK